MIMPKKIISLNCRIWTLLFLLLTTVQTWGNIQYSQEYFSSYNTSYFTQFSSSNLKSSWVLRSGVPDITHANTRLIITSNHAIANGDDKNIVTVHLADASGNPVVNKEVNFTINDGGMNVAPVILTNANGDAILNLSSYTVGNVTVTARVNGQWITNGAPAIVEFVAGSVDVNNSSTLLVVSANNAEANNIEKNIVRAELKDSWGNPVKGELVYFYINSGNASFASSEFLYSDDNGLAEVEVISSVAGEVEVMAYAGSDLIINGSPAIISFSAGAPDAAGVGTFLDIITNYEKADGISENSLLAVVGDAHGNAVEGVEVTFNIISGDGTFIGSNKVITDEWGEAFIALTSNVAGSVFVEALVGGVNIAQGSPAEVIFSAGDPDVTNPLTTIVVERTGAIANGVDANKVKVTVYDANNNKVPNAFVTFKIVSGTASFENGLDVVVSDNNGEAILNLLSSTAGEVEISAEIYGNAVEAGKIVTVEFVADVADPTAATTILSVHADNAIANGTAQNAVKVVVTDATGNLIANQAIVLNIQSGTASFVSTTIQTDANGVAYGYLHSTVAGEVEITAAIGGVNITNGSPATVTFVADAPAVTNPQTALSVVTTGSKADDIQQNTVKAIIYDANGNLVPNATVSFTIATGTATFVGSNTITTNSNGEATIHLTSGVVGNVTITATVNGTAIFNGSPASVDFVVAFPDPTAATTQLIVVDDNASADGVATNRLKVIVTDAAGNLAANTSVDFVINSGTANFVGTATVTTDANGEAFIELNSTTAGAVEVSASINGVDIVNGNPATINFVLNVVDPANPANKLELLKNNAESDGTDKVIVQITLINKDGNPIVGETVEFQKANANFQWVTGPTVTTDANGQATVELVSNIAGKGNISATVNGSGVGIQNNPVEGVFVLPIVSPTQPNTKLEVTIPTAAADGITEVEVVATVTNVAGNPIVNQNVGFYIIDGIGNFVGSATVTTDINGQAIIRLNSTTIGTVNVGAMVNGVDILNGKPAAVNFIAPVVNPSNPSTRLVVTTAQAIANGTSTAVVKAELMDTNGNPLPNATVLFSIASGVANMTNGANATTNANGEAWLYLTSTTVGQVSIEATVNGVAITNGSPAMVEFIVDDPNNPVSPFYELTVVQTGSLANGTAQNTVKAKLLDGSGNPIVGGTVDFTIANGTANFVGSNSVTTDNNGEAIIHLTSTTVGNVSITANYNGTNITVGSPAIVHFVIDVPSVTAPTTLIEVINNNAKANLFDKNSVRVTLTDANGNPISGASIQFTIASGTASMVGSNTVITNSNGYATLELISDVVGLVNITATYNGQSITNGSPAVIQFVVDQPDPTAATTRIEVVTTGASADGIAENSIKAIVTASNGNIAVNALVQFYIVNGTGALVGATTVYTNQQGEAFISIVSNVAGTVDLGASINGVDIVNGNPATVTFVTSTPDPSHAATELTIVKNNAEADGLDLVKVKIKVVNKDGNPVEGTSVDFSSSNANFQYVSGNGPTVITDANGEAEVWMNSNTVGSGTLTASIAGNTNIQNNPVTVNFITPVVSETNANTRLEVSVPTALADGVATTEVEAYVFNGSNVPLSGQTVGFYIISGVANFTPTSVAVTDANGKATIRLNSTTIGNVTIGATVNGVDIVNGKPAQVSFTNPQTPDPTNANTSLVVVDVTAPADGFTPTSVKAKVVDANGDPIQNATVEFSLTGIAANSSNLIVTTNVLGEAWIYLTSTIVGTVDLTATVDGVAITNGSPATVSFTTVDPQNPNPVYQLSVIQDNAKADGVSTNSVNAKLLDGNGDPIANATVTFSIAAGVADWETTNTAVTNANGEATIYLVSTTVGAVQVTATYNGTNITIGSPAIVNFIVPNASVTAPTTKIEVAHTGALADQVDMNAVEVTLTTDNGDPVAGEQIVFNIANGTAELIGSSTVVTNSNGKAIIYLRSNTVGAVEVAASYNGQAIVNGAPAIVHFTEQLPDMNHASTTLTVVEDNAEADLQQQNIIRATVVDVNGNPLAGFPVQFSIDAGVAIPTNPGAITTDANGVAEWRLISDVVGSVEVSASINGVSFINNNPVTVNFVMASPAVSSTNTKLEVIQDEAIANGVAENLVKATISNLLGAPVANQTVEFEIVSGTANMVTNQSGTTDANGELTLHLNSTVANIVDIRATVNGNYIINGSPAQVKFVHGPLDMTHDSTYLKVIKDSSRANGTSQNIVRLKLVDAFGNPIHDQNVNFTIESGIADPVGPLTRVTDANGISTMAFTSTTENAVVIAANVGGVAVVNGNPSTVHFIAMPDIANNNTRLDVVVDDVLADGVDMAIVKATIYDANGLPVRDVLVDFQIVSGDASFVYGGSIQTNMNGEALVHLTSTKIGVVILTAEAEGIQILNGSPAKVQFTEAELYMPKIFTPNGDGQNDVLKPYIAGLDELRIFNVYNRWGNLIFSTKNATEGWDGTYRGTPQPNETYIWMIEGINKKGEKVMRRGMVTLVR